jgi:putative ABC transport system permease protein
MRDWESYVRERLSGANWDEATRCRVTDEITELLESCEREALDSGESPDRAVAIAEAQVDDWARLVRAIDADVPQRAGTRLRARARGRSRVGAGFGRDLWSSLRSFVKHPAHTAVIVLTLALGVGANAAIFSLVDAVLLTPLPYERPDELVRIYSTHPERSLERMGVSTGDVSEWRRRNSVVEGIGGWYVMGRTLSAEETVEVVSVAQVSEDFFSVLGTRPVLGRTFTPEETARATFNSAAAHTGTDPVVVLSHGAWQQRFGGEPAILDRSVTIDRQSFRVVGVMPPAFDFPHPDVELWIPWSFGGKPPHDQRYLGAIARVQAGLSRETAESGLNAIAAALGEELPETNEGWGVSLVPLFDDTVGNARATLLIVFSAVTSVLFIACFNIASLQLVRIGERQKEIALRLALGASRPRLARQFLLENALLALAGGVLALSVALGVLFVLGVVLPEGIPRLTEVALNVRGLLYAAVLAVSAGVFFGLVPVLAGPKDHLSSSMNEAGGRTSGGAPRWERMRKVLVVSELAMAVVLLAASGLLVRSFAQLMEVDVGFRPDHVVVLPIALDNHEYRNGNQTRTYYRTLMEKLAAVPGVESVGGVTALPMSPIGPDFDRPIWAEGDTPPPGGSRRADVRMATTRYFETIGIAIRRGRAFDDSDTPDSPKVVLVNESLARLVWPGEDPVGKRLVIDYSTAGTYPYEVIGVASDIRFYGIRSEPQPELYLSHTQRPYLILNVAVRTSVEPASLVTELRRTVLEVDPMQPAYSVVPLDELVTGSIGRDRFAMLLIGSFGVVALALALMGIFGVLSYHVRQRTREVGIRSALGASQRDILAMILSAGARLTLVGIAVGVVAALLATRSIASLLFGVSPMDPLTFVIVTVLPAAGALVACYLPARRAAAVDPLLAIRHE